MTTNVVGLRSSWLNAPVSSSIKACDNAFRLLGLFNSSMATPLGLMETIRLGDFGIFWSISCLLFCQSEIDSVWLDGKRLYYAGGECPAQVRGAGLLHESGKNCATAL
jgi:hypothetical protein